jgi:hypothetical protein
MIQSIAWSWVGVLAAAHVMASGERALAAARLLSVACGLTFALLAVNSVRAATEGPVRALVTTPADTVMQPIPSPDVAPYRTAHGVELLVPTGDNRCGNAPLHCTPHPSLALALREGGSITAGFRTVGGEWTPERWPNPFTGFLSWWRCVQGAPAGDRTAETRCLAAPGQRP